MTVTFSQMRHLLKLIKHKVVNLTERRGEERKSLCLLVFLTLSSTWPQPPGDTSLNPKSKLAPRCGNPIQFPLFREGQTQATLSLLIAYEAIKSQWGLSFSARRVTTSWLPHLLLRWGRHRKDLRESQQGRSYSDAERPNVAFFPR